MVKKEDCTQSNDSNSSLSSTSSSSSFVNTFQEKREKNHQAESMQNLANQLVAAAVGNGSPILCAAPSGQSDVAQVYFQNDLSNPYKLQAAAVHLINQAAQQHQNTNSSKDLSREKRTDNRLANNISSSSSSGSNNGSEIVEVAQETNRKREIRLLKNREAARECRRKKKEYIKCLENRVAVLETQNKTLIEELKTLKELYCQTGENTNSNKNSSNSHSSSASQQNAASSKA